MSPAVSIELKLAGGNTHRIRFNCSHVFTDVHMASSGDYRRPIHDEQGNFVVSLLSQC